MQYGVLKLRASDEYYTPIKVINMAREVMGDIDLDPATSEAAQLWIRAREYYTIVDDGLRYEWKGKVWLNPPFNAQSCKDFLFKLTTSDNVTEYTAITPMPANVTWNQIIAADADLMCFPNGRPRFYNAVHDKLTAPTPIMYWYRGPNTDKFRDVFSRLGVVR